MSEGRDLDFAGTLILKAHLAVGGGGDSAVGMSDQHSSAEREEKRRIQSTPKGKDYIMPTRP